ncbi:MAG: hypothetical protein GYA22_14855 [Bacteroidales bacterium]|nr:hypothetical protein [Bacteroidales bacterium]
MRIHILIFFATLTIMLAACSGNAPKEDINKNIPSLEDLSGIWVSTDTVEMEPSIRNFRGQALVNRDLASISWFVSAPYSGGYHTGTLRINGKTPKVNSFRWQPYQALRKGQYEGVDLLSSTRMLFEQDGIMWQIEMKNSTDEPKKVRIDLDLIGFISKYGGDWQWWYPYPKMDGSVTKRDEEVENVRKHLGEPVHQKEGYQWELVNGKPALVKTMLKWPTDEEILNAKKYHAHTIKNDIYVYDHETEAKTAFRLVTAPDRLIAKNSGGTASWDWTLAPGETKVIRYVMTYGDDEKSLQKNLNEWTADFESSFNSVQKAWEEKWNMIFRPGNPLISGCFPVLETNDQKVKKVYYAGPLTMLYLINTNLPQHKKVFLTGGPRWGASITFFWDITLWSTLWAAVDPVMMKEHLSSWIRIDPSKFYGKDNFGGKGVGNGYSANYWALFQMIRDYVAITGDEGFLQDTINEKTVLGHLEDYALNWKKISLYGQEGCTDDLYKLADFGDDEWNLLECVPTYKHIVPSFNVGYAWMMRELAKIYNKLGSREKAAELDTMATDMIQRILKLYAGNGVWYSLYPNEKKIEVRHCLDFFFIGKYIPNDVPENIRKEMIDFLYRELMADHWMRAQSVDDVAAAQSDRPDHGPLGAYDGWPAETMDALTQMGYPQKALDFYHAIEPVTYEGIWAQAHELWGENKKTSHAWVRIAERGWHNRESSGGVSLSQVVLKDFFGFYPQIGGEALQTHGPFELSGKLYHVLYKNAYYTIILQNGKPKMIRERF